MEMTVILFHSHLLYKNVIYQFGNILVSVNL